MKRFLNIKACKHVQVEIQNTNMKLKLCIICLLECAICLCVLMFLLFGELKTNYKSKESFSTSQTCSIHTRHCTPSGLQQYQCQVWSWLHEWLAQRWWTNMHAHTQRRLPFIDRCFMITLMKATSRNQSLRSLFCSLWWDLVSSLMVAFLFRLFVFIWESNLFLFLWIFTLKL